MLIMSWYILYFISSQVLIKFDQLKLLNAVNISALSYSRLCIHTFPILSINSVAQKEEAAMKMLLVLGVRNP
jgi:hypothetical protein